MNDIDFVGGTFIAKSPKAVVFFLKEFDSDLMCVENEWDCLGFMKELEDLGFKLREIKPTKKEIERVYKEFDETYENL